MVACTKRKYKIKGHCSNDLFLFPMKEGERSLELFKLFGTVVVETKEAIESLQDTSKEAEKTSDSVGELGDKSKKAGKTTTDSVKPIPSNFSKVAKAGATVVSAFTAIVSAAVALAESTREYRLEMGKLETAFETAGHTTEEAAEVYETFYSILGETDRAVEVSQHIAKLCDSEEQMKAMTEACIGAFALFDDSLPIEGLVEAANETAKTGQVTGVLADALNWAGSSEEEFQKKLENCNTERERAALITEELTDLYGDASKAYQENNKDIISATKAQEKLTAATSKLGKAVEPLVTKLKNGLAVAIEHVADGFSYLIEYGPIVQGVLFGVSETVEDAAEKVELFKSRLETLEETPPALWTPELQAQKDQLVLALATAESQYDKLVEAEREAAEEASEAVESTAGSVEKFTEITDKYVEDAKALFEGFAETYDNIKSKVSGWFEPFEKESVRVNTSITQMLNAMQSQIDFNNAYSENLQKLKEYGLGSLSEAFQTYGAEGSVYADKIVTAVEKAGGATTEEGQRIIQQFSEMNTELKKSQEGLSETMWLMDGDVEQALQNMTETYGIAIEDLDKSEEASSAAISTFEAFLQGMNDKLPEITSTMESFGAKITSSLQSGIGSVSIPVSITTAGKIPGHETGLDYVPYDDYLAYLHKGEAVLTAEEANAWRSGKEVASNTNAQMRSAGEVVETKAAGQNEGIVYALSKILEEITDSNKELLQAVLSGQTIVLNNRELGRVVREYA